MVDSVLTRCTLGCNINVRGVTVLADSLSKNTPITSLKLDSARRAVFAQWHLIDMFSLICRQQFR